ncbi:MAG: hypothetical protein ACLFV7_13515 [Phycisphaerae bacterium]
MTGMRRNVMIGVAVSLLFVGVGCSGGGNFRDAGRARRLMDLAAVEAGKIDTSAERLARQLRIADMQIDRGDRAGAMDTLGGARTTLQTDGRQLSEHLHIAGWVSVCELARRAGRQDFAAGALDEALQLLRAVEPAPQRCQYVLGVAHEVRRLRGKEASADLLREATAWAVDLSPETRRRKALRGIAADLFLCDDYDGGMLAIRKDAEPRWRSDTLAELAAEATPYKYGSVWFGRSMDYQATFKQFSGAGK